MPSGHKAEAPVKGQKKQKKIASAGIEIPANAIFSLFKI